MQGKAVPVTGCEGPEMAMRLSALRAGHPIPQEDSWYSFLLEAESTPGP
jgi:hypothetical protein